MFIHFAFGNLGKSGEIQEQTNAVIEYILREKRLKITKCKEFIPVFPQKGSKPIPLKPFKRVDGRADLVVAEINGNRLTDVDSIHYLPEDVPMTCFIKINFNQLKNSTHDKEYGKLGIILTSNFLKRNGIKRVQYYTEESLYSDPLILKWNQEQAMGKLSDVAARQLQKEITAYRKPAKLFSSFEKSVSHIIHFGSGGPQTDTFTYNRYVVDYDFTKENEYRIVADEGINYIDFEEDDLYMIITPNQEVKSRIEFFLNQNWGKRPKVEIYPT